MKLKTTRTTKTSLSLTNSASHGIHSENNDAIVENKMAADSDVISGDSPVIGASLIPFLPPDPTKYGRERMFVNIDEATMRNSAILDMPPERYGISENKTDLDKLRDRYHHKGDGECSKRNDCLSLLLDGKTSMASTDGCASGVRGRCKDRSGQQTRKSRKRILLRGPPQSGKTSLSMNLAYAEAAAGSNCCGGLPCGCVAVVVYKPSIRSHIDDKHKHGRKYYNRVNEFESIDEHFPLFCRALQVQRGQLSREDTNSDETNDRTNAGSDATTRGNTEVATSSATKQDEEYFWDPNILNRIRICRVSSVRDLWEDMLVLAGKPLHEQPTHAIVVEDLDRIIGLRGKSSNPNYISGNSFDDKKQSLLLGMALKTVAIAADTAMVIEKHQNECHRLSPRSNCVTLLVTLTMDSREQQSDTSTNTSNHKPSMATDSTDMSDILVLASSIDTLVTLHQQERSKDNTTLETNNHDDYSRETISCSHEEPIAAATLTTVQTTKSGNDIESCNGSTKNNINKNDLTNEKILVNSVWQAEIEERGSDQYYENIRHGVNGKSDGVLQVDYAFVESFLAKDSNCGLGECEGIKEIRWKHN